VHDVLHDPCPMNRDSGVGYFELDLLWSLGFWESLKDHRDPLTKILPIELHDIFRQVVSSYRSSV
jgi:hypothetical protein